MSSYSEMKKDVMLTAVCIAAVVLFFFIFKVIFLLVFLGLIGISFLVLRAINGGKRNKQQEADLANGILTGMIILVIIGFLYGMYWIWSSAGQTLGGREYTPEEKTQVDKILEERDNDVKQAAENYYRIHGKYPQGYSPY